MNPGDEITCDYNLFEYDCKGKEIEVCQCGAANCIGQIRGFKYLTTDEKKKRLTNVDESVMQWYVDESEGKIQYITDLKIPSSVSIENVGGQFSEPEFRIKSEKKFEAGDIIFYRESEFVTPEELIIMKIQNYRLWFGPRHLVQRSDNCWEFFGFDSFQNHSCDPNTIMVYNSDKKSYSLRCKKSIKVGDELTSDYETFDENLDGVSFQCCCGSSNCRGTIKA